MSGRTPRILVDTMLWLYYLLGNERLKPSLCEKMDKSAKSGKLLLSAASISECAEMIARGTLTLQQQSEKWLEQAIVQSKTQVMPVDTVIAMEAELLPKPPTSLESYEKLILATARTHNVTLLTQRKNFLAYANTGFIKVVS